MQPTFVLVPLMVWRRSLGRQVKGSFSVVFVLPRLAVFVSLEALNILYPVVSSSFGVLLDVRTAQSGRYQDKRQFRAVCLGDSMYEALLRHHHT